MGNLYFCDGNWYDETEYQDYLEARYQKYLEENPYEDMPDPFEDR